MRNRLITPLIVFFIVGFGIQGVASSPVLTLEQMREDLGYVADLITRVHPDPFHSGSEEEFQELLGELKEMIEEPMERDKFWSYSLWRYSTQIQK